MVSKVAAKLTDLRMPHEWWSKARSIERDFHLHIGPTNSGKTFAALEKLKVSKKGVYCGPLRLLATEVCDKLNDSGVKCSLFTGQETRIIPNATHISCTLEALNFDEDYDCALIDEIQMIEDYYRGSAWTYAVLGLSAREVHLTGEARSRQVVESLLAKTKDRLSVHQYKRLSPLFLSPPVSSIKSLQPGDCLVAFSRIKCHALKNFIEKFEPGSCSIIYGRLPPLVRVSQAEKFNSGKHKYLISTDAIGMGLNYNINRLIFTETQKNDGASVKALTASEIKQIAGRAGRFERKGLVTATSLDKLNDICVGINFQSNSFITQAGLSPMFEMIQDFIDLKRFDLSSKTYTEMIKMYKKEAKLESLYFLQSFKEACSIADKLNSLKLPFDLIHHFANSKINLSYEKSLSVIRSYAELVKLEKEVKFQDFRENLNEETLPKLEMLYNFSENYFTLAKKIGTHIFVDWEEVSRYKQSLSDVIQEKITIESNNLYGFRFKDTGYLDVFN